MNPSFFHTTDFISLFISHNNEDLNLANDILNQTRADADRLDDLIEVLNSSCGEWHFFMENFCIRRIASSKKMGNNLRRQSEEA